MMGSDSDVVGGDEDVSDKVAFDNRDVSTGFPRAAGSAGRGRVPRLCGTAWGS